MQTWNHYINGEWITPSSGEYFDTENPYTSEIWAQVARGNATDADRAAKAAKAAFEHGEWADMRPTQRGKLLVRLAEIIEREAGRLGELEVKDNGKLIAEMGAQTKYLAEWYRYFGGLADKVEGAVLPSDRPGVFNFTRHEPLGVVGMITAWNSPLLLLAWKLAPALAAGNTAVVKPSEFTSVSSLAFMELIAEAGFPAGVVNCITGMGTEVGQPLVDHPDVAKIAFTGSDVAGQRIYESAAKKIMPVTLELGGKSPNIVFADAPDLKQAAQVSAMGIFRDSGQVCVSGSRLLVEESVRDEFLGYLQAAAEGLRVGDPLNLENQVGAINNAQQLQKNLGFVDTALNEGAELVTGGQQIHQDSGGYFMAPTIFSDVRPGMQLAREEVFGPVLGVMTFKDEAEAVRLANDTEYGLAAGAWTANLSRAHRMVRALKAGVVHINTYGGPDVTVPLGGVKQSGNGVDKSLHALEKYTDLKTAWIQL